MVLEYSNGKVDDVPISDILGVWGVSSINDNTGRLVNVFAER